MAEKSSEHARENALVEAASKLYPRLELECEGKRAVCVGGHEDDIDSINVVTGGEVILLSTWVLEHCLKQPDGTTGNPKEDRRLTLTKPHVVAYGNQHVHKTPLLQWCREMCKANGVQDLRPGTPLLVFWWDMEHSKQDKAHTCGHTWWPAVYAPKYDEYGVWFSARVVEYDQKWASLKIVYDYNSPEELELGKVILPLNFVHFGSTPPPLGGVAQVFPPPWKPPVLKPCQHQIYTNQPKKELRVLQGKPTAAGPQHRPAPEQQHWPPLQARSSPAATRNEQAWKQEQDLSSEGPALLSLPSQPPPHEFPGDAPGLLQPPTRPTVSSPHQLQPGSPLQHSQPRPMLQQPVAAGKQGACTDKLIEGAGPIPSTAAANSAAPQQLSVVPASSCKPAVAKMPSGSGKRGTWAMDDDLDESGSAGLDASGCVKRQKGSSGQAVPAIPSSQQQQQQQATSKQRQPPSDTNATGGRRQQTPNNLGLPPRPPSRGAAAGVGGSGGASSGTVQGTDPKRKHTFSTDIAKPQKPRPAASAGDGGAGQQQILDIPPAKASTPAAAAPMPAEAAQSTKTADKAAVSADAVGVRGTKASSSQVATGSGSKQAASISQQQQVQRHHSPSPSVKAGQPPTQQQPSRPQPSQPQLSQQQPVQSRTKQQQPKPKPEQRSTTPQLSVDTGMAGAAAASEGPAASMPSTTGRAGASQQAAVVWTSSPSAAGARPLAMGPRTAGAATAGSALPPVDLTIGPTSRVMWRGNRQHTGGTASKAAELLLRPPAVRCSTIPSEADIRALLAARGTPLPAAGSVADLLRIHVPQQGLAARGSNGEQFRQQHSPSCPSQPQAIAAGTMGAATPQQQQPLRSPSPSPPLPSPQMAAARDPGPGGAGAAAGLQPPPAAPAAAATADTHAVDVSAGTAASGGVQPPAAADASPAPSAGPDDGVELPLLNGVESSTAVAAAAVASVAATAALAGPAVGGGPGAAAAVARTAAPADLRASAPAAAAAAATGAATAGLHFAAPATVAAAADVAAPAAPTLAGCLASLRDTMSSLSCIAGAFTGANPMPPPPQRLSPAPGAAAAGSCGTAAASGSGTAAAATAGAGASGSGTFAAATVVAPLFPRKRGCTPTPPSDDDDNEEEEDSDSDDAFAFMDRRQYRLALPPEERLAAYEALVPERRASGAAGGAGTPAAAAPPPPPAERS